MAHKVTINHYINKEDPTISALSITYIMDYDDWKKTYAEYLERYTKETANFSQHSNN